MYTLHYYTLKAREIQAHLSALRALCQGLLEKMRVGPDIMASAPLPGSAGSMGWKELRALNRIMALRGRDDIVAREDRCVRCMVKVRETAGGWGVKVGGCRR